MSKEDTIMTQDCGNCFYSRNFDEIFEGEPIGECRRRCPVITHFSLSFDKHSEHTSFPIVKQSEWCGEWMDEDE